LLARIPAKLGILIMHETGRRRTASASEPRHWWHRLILAKAPQAGPLVTSSTIVTGFDSGDHLV